MPSSPERGPSLADTWRTQDHVSASPSAGPHSCHARLGPHQGHIRPNARACKSLYQAHIGRMWTLGQIYSLRGRPASRSRRVAASLGYEWLRPWAIQAAGAGTRRDRWRHSSPTSGAAWATRWTIAAQCFDAAAYACTHRSHFGSSPLYHPRVVCLCPPPWSLLGWGGGAWPSPQHLSRRGGRRDSAISPP